MPDGGLADFMPEIPGSAGFGETRIVGAIARAGYGRPEGGKRPVAPPPEPALPREGGVFGRFPGGFREDTR